MQLYRGLLFKPDKYPDGLSAVDMAAHTNATIEPIDFSSGGRLASGATINAWYLRCASPCGLTALVSHGNAGTIASRGYLLKWLCELGFDVFIYDYRGYGKSSSLPTVPGVLQDGLSACDYLVSRGVAPRDILLYGESIGVAVSTYISSKRAVRAMILQSGFSSLRQIAADLYPVLKVYGEKLFCNPPLNSAHILAASHVPVLIFHGKKDPLVPVTHAHKLYESAAGQKTLVLFDDVQHSDFIELKGADMALAVRQFLPAIYGLEGTALSANTDTPEQIAGR